MKNLLRTLVFSLFFVLANCFSSAAQWVAMEDTSFGNWLNMNGYSTCLQGNSLAGWQMDTTCGLVLNATQLSCTYVFNLKNLSGIRYFKRLKVLDCYQNELTSLAPLPDSLEILNCYSNQLTLLPDLPPRIQKLFCSTNALVNLPNLPASLVELTCSENQLTHLPNLPNGLVKLNCSRNALQSIDSLPPQLNKLYCSYNDITTLPMFSQNLKEIDCSYTQLTHLPELPDSLYQLICEHNPYLLCLPQLKKIKLLRFDPLHVVCLPNYPLSNQWCSPSLGTVPLCDTTNYTNYCVALPLSTNRVYPDVFFSIFPNPTFNSFTISIPETLIGSVLNITDMTGKQIAAVQLQTVNTTLETGIWANGIYFVRVGNSTKKLIVQK